MESRLGDDATSDRASLLRAQQLLMDPQARSAAETLAPWDDEPVLATWAPAQSAAVLWLTTLFSRPTRVSEGELMSTVSAWVDLAEDELLADSFVQRQSEYGSTTPVRLAELIGTWIIAGILKRVLESCPGAAAQCLNETSGFSGESRRAIEDAVVQVILATVTEPSEGPGPTAAAAASAVTDAGAALGQLENNGPAHERLHDAILGFANSLAVDFYNADDFESSEVVLGAAVAAPLNSQATAKFRGDLRTVRYTRGWREANRGLERKDYDGCLIALQNALQSAPTAEDARETERTIAGVLAKRKTTGLGGLARRAWGAFGGFAILIGIVVGIGMLGDCEDEGQSRSRANIPSSAPTATRSAGLSGPGSSPIRPTASRPATSRPATARPAPTPDGALAEAVDAYFESTDDRDLDIAEFEEARDSFGFGSAAARAEQ